MENSLVLLAMSLYGYGEDFLTLWLIKEYPDKIIDDKTAPEKSTIFYRPSFGRLGKSETKASSQFGEFDAIVSTSKTVYLIESKWDGTLKNPEKAKQIVIADHQVNRHKILEWYIKNWEITDWSLMPVEKVKDFSSQFKNNTIAPKGSRVRENIQTVLQKIGSVKNVKHLIVYFSKGGFPEIKLEYDNISFKVVRIEYHPDLDNFLSLDV